MRYIYIYIYIKIYFLKIKLEGWSPCPSSPSATLFQIKLLSLSSRVWIFGFLWKSILLYERQINENHSKRRAHCFVYFFFRAA